jgi:hypothetical protein
VDQVREELDPGVDQDQAELGLADKDAVASALEAEAASALEAEAASGAEVTDAEAEQDVDSTEASCPEAAAQDANRENTHLASNDSPVHTRVEDNCAKRSPHNLDQKHIRDGTIDNLEYSARSTDHKLNHNHNRRSARCEHTLLSSNHSTFRSDIHSHHRYSSGTDSNTNPNTIQVRIDQHPRRTHTNAYSNHNIVLSNKNTEILHNVRRIDRIHS